VHELQHKSKIETTISYCCLLACRDQSQTNDKMQCLYILESGNERADFVVNGLFGTQIVQKWKPFLAVGGSQDGTQNGSPGSAVTSNHGIL
jgi:hypothetical protein